MTKNDKINGTSIVGDKKWHNVDKLYLMNYMPHALGMNKINSLAYFFLAWTVSSITLLNWIALLHSSDCSSCSSLFRERWFGTQKITVQKLIYSVRMGTGWSRKAPQCVELILLYFIMLSTRFSICILLVNKT